jgi:hypothetical protein
MPAKTKRATYAKQMSPTNNTRNHETIVLTNNTSNHAKIVPDNNTSNHAKKMARVGQTNVDRITKNREIKQ